MSNKTATLLPSFPRLVMPITEDRIERSIELLMDRADKLLMVGGCSQADYDAWVASLDDWAWKQTSRKETAR